MVVRMPHTAALGTLPLPDGSELWRKQTASDEWIEAFCNLVTDWKPVGRHGLTECT